MLVHSLATYSLKITAWGRWDIYGWELFVKGIYSQLRMY